MMGVDSLLCRAVALVMAFLPLVSSQEKIVNVRYGYFPEARPVHAACGRGWMDYYDEASDTLYQVGCYPQTSGGFAASRLDNGHLDIAHLGSTPLAEALARGVDIQVLYNSHYMGDSQGVYVRASQGDYVGIQEPKDLANRTIGVPYGSTMHYQVLFLLEVFGLTLEDVELLNLSPTEIIDDWDNRTLDVGACWGKARDHLLKQGGKGNVGLLPARTFMSSRSIANWGRLTFVDVAARRQFAKEHRNFLVHLVAVLSRINDSFLDRLEIEHIERWDSTRNSSYVRSMVDALMDSDEPANNPSLSSMNLQRSALDLFDQISANELLSCDYFGRGNCSQPTRQHESIRQTAEFLLNQKIISRLGRLKEMGEDTACQADDTFCGSDLLDGTFLKESQRSCGSCYPLGPYRGINTTSETLLIDLEEQDRLAMRAPYALMEIGRNGGNSVCSDHSVVSSSGTGTFGDGANAIDGTVYSSKRNCTWEIRATDCFSSSSTCNDIVQVSFDQVRLWSGDFVKIYTDPNFLCSPNITGNETNNDLRLIAQVTGIDVDFPPISAQGCVMVQFVTDANIERSYGDVLNTGYGFVASYDRAYPACSSINDCSGRSCNVETGLCDCGGDRWGSDCSFSDFCFGTTRIALSRFAETLGSNEAVGMGTMGLQSDDDIVDPTSAYPNDLYCTFEVQVTEGNPFVEFIIAYDLEPTHDLLWVLTGVDQPYAVLTGASTDKEKIVVPTDKKTGIASLRLTTDSLGRRSGFRATAGPKDEARKPSGIDCDDGYSGVDCEFPHCIAQNVVSKNTIITDISPSYVVGRIVSQNPSLAVRPMPWAEDEGCRWSIPLDKAPQKTTALRLVFNKELDLEPFPRAAVGDKLIIQNDDGSDKFEFFVEECTSDDDCPDNEWQTGTCLPDGGGCKVRKEVEVPVSASSSNYSAVLVTDRNDGPGSYSGLDFDVLFVESCPVANSHCKDQNGTCDSETGYCICESGVPCGCRCHGDVITPDGSDGSDDSDDRYKATVIIVVASIFIIFIGNFFWYRRQKNITSRERKRLIETIRGTAAIARKVHAPLFMSTTDKSQNEKVMPPIEIIDEPQMVLVPGDIVQIATEREDGWARGKKLFHKDENEAQRLVQVAMKEKNGDTKIVRTDEGWFKLDATDVPDGGELAPLLQNNIGLDPPPNWSPVLNPFAFQLDKLESVSSEYKEVYDAFMSASSRSSQDVRIDGIERIQNLGLWQGYVVKREQIFQQIVGSDGNGQETLGKYERRWLWHGTKADSVGKILQRGFDRSFRGRNGTKYGQGVYFAVSAKKSMNKRYSIPDEWGVRYIIASRVMVGKCCLGCSNDVVPEFRNEEANLRYDSTVDKMKNPSIFVIYQDAQAYPEYLIKFRVSTAWEGDRRRSSLGTSTEIRIGSDATTDDDDDDDDDKDNDDDSEDDDKSTDDDESKSDDEDDEEDEETEEENDDDTKFHMLV